jgi:hypothetical protein
MMEEGIVNQNGGCERIVKKDGKCKRSFRGRRNQYNRATHAEDDTPVTHSADAVLLLPCLCNFQKREIVHFVAVGAQQQRARANAHCLPPAQQAVFLRTGRRSQLSVTTGSRVIQSMPSSQTLFGQHPRLSTSTFLVFGKTSRPDQRPRSRMDHKTQCTTFKTEQWRNEATASTAQRSATE